MLQGQYPWHDNVSFNSDHTLDSKMKQTVDILQNLIQKYGARIGLVLSLYIIGQYGLLGFVNLLSKIDGSNSRYVDFGHIYLIGFYTIIILGVTILHINKQSFLDDNLSLWIIALACFIRPAIGGKYEAEYNGYMLILTLYLVAYILINKKTIRAISLKIVGGSLLWALSTLLILALILASRDYKQPNISQTNLLFNFLYHLSFVVVIEETLFRGLIFGFLTLNSFKENVALATQGFLFWLIHFNQIGDPLAFFVFIPLLTLSTTIIMKKYKTVFSPILVHLIVNIFVNSLAAWVHFHIIG